MKADIMSFMMPPLRNAKVILSFNLPECDYHIDGCDRCELSIVSPIFGFPTPFLKCLSCHSSLYLLTASYEALDAVEDIALCVPECSRYSLSYVSNPLTMKCDCNQVSFNV